MKTYEIRVLPHQQIGADIYSSTHMDDYAAVRRATTLAKAGESIEVWCGARCVYAGEPPVAGLH